ncbi:hypothetical protein G6Z19_06085, partial [Clostridium perfringens]|nr:hypothetical protein [Clostridium perfringens]
RSPILLTLICRFKDNEYIVGFRNPHISVSNIGQHTNKKINDFEKYFNCTSNIVFFNAIGVPILSMYNGEDYDSDSNLLTNNSIIVKSCEKINKDFKIPKNDISAIKVKRDFTDENMAEVDHIISQNLIGQVVNTSQEINSLLNNILNNGNIELNSKHNIKDLYNRASKLSSISNCEIDKAKKNFEDLRVNRELDNIKVDLLKVKDVFNEKEYSKDNRRVKPLFFKVIGDTKALKQRKLTDKKELEKRNSIAIEKYIEDKKLKKEDVINKKGKIKKEHIELINILNNIKKEWEVWKDKIYVEYATPMDMVQVELDKIKDSKRSKNIYLRDLLKEVKHKADKEEINKLALQIEDLDKKLKAINLNVDMTYKDKVITKEELKRTFVIYIREQKLTKAKIYHLLKRCFKIKKNNKEEKEVIKGIENITIEIMFRTYGDKFIDMFKSYTK